MKAFKLLAIPVALTMVAGVVGCSQGTDNKTSSPTPQPTAQTTAAPQSAKPDEKKVDLNGQSIKIGVWYDGADPRTAKEKGPAEEAQIKLIEAAEKKYNCKIEFVKFGDYNKYVENFTTTSLSGQPFADIVRMELFWAFPQLANKGFVQPIDQWIKVSDP
ncbi:hypothetical protein [Paenibacillus sp. V4I5]|nr:hypothetical protein [Paenibacillus sp. V4I5]MDQ0918837.1 ABC-type metal ion transport system substrate-binding protein [Paenibacillus sp. V4I5]